MPHGSRTATALGGRENGKYGRYLSQPTMEEAVVTLGL
jgi:hypothetical protein